LHSGQNLANPVLKLAKPPGQGGLAAALSPLQLEQLVGDIERGEYRDAVGAYHSTGLAYLSHAGVKQPGGCHQIVPLVGWTGDAIVLVQDPDIDSYGFIDHRLSSIARSRDSMASTLLRACSVFSINSPRSATSASWRVRREAFSSCRR
jgi:hypothetical protein